jgi:hypothetical protein
MIEPLAETERLCKEIVALSSLNNQSSSLIIKSRVESLFPKILESKKKMMLKSPKGKELAEEALKNVMKLHELITKSQWGLMDDISKQISLLEINMEKIEIYWKSFEYATT